MRSSNQIIIYSTAAVQPLKVPLNSMCIFKKTVYKKLPQNDWLKIRKEARHSFAPPSQLYYPGKTKYGPGTSTKLFIFVMEKALQSLKIKMFLIRTHP